MAVMSVRPPDQRAGYEAFFGLSESPFSLVPDPRFLFASATHSAALAQVAYALERREPLVVITGDIGTGKTLLCRTVLQRLPFKTFLSVIHDPLLEADDLIKELLRDFGVIGKDPSRYRNAKRHELVQTLHAFLSSLAPIKAHAVVMIDEAQHLRPDVLEQIRLLSNIDDARGTILQIILVGQMDLEPLLSRPDLRQLQQRVSRRFALDPLNQDEVQQYIEHRLALAQRQPASGPTNPGVAFTPDAMRAVAEISGGVPRVINLLCDRSLELAFDAEVRSIDSPRVQAAARGLGIGKPTTAAADIVEPAAPAQAAPIEPAIPPVIAPEKPADPIPAFEPLTHLEPRKPPIPIAAIEPIEPFEPFEPFPPPAPIEEILSDAMVPPAGPQGTKPTKYLVLALVVAVLGAAIVFGYQRLQTPATLTPPPSQPAPRAGSPAASPGTGTATPQPQTPPAPTATLPPSAGGAPAIEPSAAAERFDIVVASFRTEARATSVADEVAALGVAVRRRESDGWQQIIAGPFDSRAAAEAAQQRIHGAGLTGTQITPSTR